MPGRPRGEPDPLEHDHVVRLYDFGVVEDRPYLVMEYVRGAPIDHRIDLFAAGVVTWEALDYPRSRRIAREDRRQVALRIQTEESFRDNVNALFSTIAS